MALIAAALAADGTSRVGPLETVERGYANLVDRLAALGACVDVEPNDAAPQERTGAVTDRSRLR
jgi:UDP-N-acetylglucosamine enolpyruvyl transferase